MTDQKYDANLDSSDEKSADVLLRRLAINYSGWSALSIGMMETVPVKEGDYFFSLHDNKIFVRHEQKWNEVIPQSYPWHYFVPQGGLIYCIPDSGSRSMIYHPAGSLLIDPLSGDLYQSDGGTWSLKPQLLEPAGPIGSIGPGGMTGAMGPGDMTGPSGIGNSMRTSNLDDGGPTGCRGARGPTGCRGVRGPTDWQESTSSASQNQSDQVQAKIEPCPYARQDLPCPYPNCQYDHEMQLSYPDGRDWSRRSPEHRIQACPDYYRSTRCKLNEEKKCPYKHDDQIVFPGWFAVTCSLCSTKDKRTRYDHRWRNDCKLKCRCDFKCSGCKEARQLVRKLIVEQPPLGEGEIKVFELKYKVYYRNHIGTECGRRSEYDTQYSGVSDSDSDNDDEQRYAEGKKSVLVTIPVDDHITTCLEANKRAAIEYFFDNHDYEFGPKCYDGHHEEDNYCSYGRMNYYIKAVSISTRTSNRIWGDD